MKILMLGRFLPPPRRPVRATREYQFAHHLARTHQLTLAFITDNHDAAGAISTLRTDFGDLEFALVPRAWKSLASAVRLAAGDSCTLSYFRSEALRSRIVERLRKTEYDLVFVSSSSMIQYALEMDPAVPVAVDFGDVDSEWWMRQAARGTFPSARFLRTEAVRLRMAEAAVARRASLRLAASSEAADIVRSFASESPTLVIPNGLEVGSEGMPRRREKTPTIVFNACVASDIHIQDVIEFHRTAMPMIRSRVPTSRFLIVSREPAPPTRCGAELPGADLAVDVAEPGRLLRQATVAVVPLRKGTGLRSAVLEAMAANLPVVSTSAVLEGLGLDGDHGIQVADDPTEFAMKVIRLLEDETLRTELGARGRRFVADRYTWSHMATQVGRAIDSVGRQTKRALPADGEALAPASL